MKLTEARVRSFIQDAFSDMDTDEADVGISAEDSSLVLEQYEDGEVVRRFRISVHELGQVLGL